MRIKRYISIALLTLSASVMTSQSAFSHAGFNGTFPSDGERLAEAPSYLEITLSEGVTIGSKPVTLIDSQGLEIALSTPNVEISSSGSKLRTNINKKINEGWYAVQWQVISKDGHPKTGSYTFIVGNETEVASSSKPKDPTAPFKLLANPLAFLAYISTLLALGLLLSAWPLKTIPKAQAKTLKWSAYAATLGIVVAPLNVLNFALLLNGGTLDGLGSVFMVALQSTSGTAQLIRISALFAICAAILLATEKSFKVVSVVTGSVGAVALTYSYAITGHTSVVPLEIIAAPSLVIHLLAASAWLGGVPSIYWAFKNRAQSTREELVEVINKYSKIATISVISVGVAGAVVSVSMFKSISEVQGRYGLTLLIKILLVLSVAALGAYNHFKAVPEVRNSLNSSEEASEKSMEKLTRTLKIESLYVLAIALLTTALTSSGAPAAGGNHGISGAHGHRGISSDIAAQLEDDTPLVIQSTLGDGGVEVRVKPSRVSEKIEIRVRTLDALGNQRPAGEVYLYLSMPEKNIGPLKRGLKTESDGSLTLTTSDIGLPGKWVIEVEERVSALRNQKVEISVDVLPRREVSS
ncbi:MAG: copper resistance CopC/CopD family protein [Candidatus Paceibacterota bacterium]